MPEILVRGFEGCPGARALVTLRPSCGAGDGHCGFNLADHVGDESQAVARRREALSRILPFPVAWLNQTHSSRVAVIGAKGDLKGGPLDADGAVTCRRKIACAVLTADCLPVLIASPCGMVGAIHAGWRGIASGALENAVSASGAAPHEIRCWIGPHIRRESYTVGEEVKDRLASEPEDERAFERTGGQGAYLCDLLMLASARLHRAGVRKIESCPMDTARCPGLLFSARRDGFRTGRMAALIWRA